MHVELSDRTERWITEQMSSGRYRSPDELIAHALRVLSERDHDRQAATDRLRREVMIGIDQADRGELTPFDADEIRREGRRALAERRGKTS